MILAAARFGGSGRYFTASFCPIYNRYEVTFDNKANMLKYVLPGNSVTSM
jgi:hypothetical protein